MIQKSFQFDIEVQQPPVSKKAETIIIDATVDDGKQILGEIWV